jgi:hypothetical protein
MWWLMQNRQNQDSTCLFPTWKEIGRRGIQALQELGGSHTRALLELLQPMRHVLAQLGISWPCHILALLLLLLHTSNTLLQPFSLW